MKHKRRHLLRCNRCGLLTNRLKAHIRQMHWKQYRRNSMTTQDIQNLIDMIEAVVRAPTGGTWQEKRDQILGTITEEETSALQEFASWFDGIDMLEDKR